MKKELGKQEGCEQWKPFRIESTLVGYRIQKGLH